MSLNTNIFLVSLCVLIFCVAGNGVHAFGAGNIPSYAYLEGRAFRHGDIEDTLSAIAKKAGGFALGALIGKGGIKFGGLDIKRVYFGNWLRDYSQAVDVSSLEKLDLQTIINLCMVLGFLAHGYATNEFEVTPDRLGVYLPTEHIDNPKGYPDNAQSFHPKLRGPVNPAELEVDPRTGMKNYIANENGHWDTSKALVRRTLIQCIQLGRQHRANSRKQDEYEAYRLLGQALHTVEDFAAHSNFCELALVSMGHKDVFVHIGDQVRLQAHNGQWVAPLVTGTFGSSDFIHSLLGEASDHISSASVSDLNAELNRARARSGPGGPSSNGPAETLRQLFFSLPGGDGSEMSREMDSVERIRANPTQGGKRPEEMSPQELHSVLWQVLSFRDSVVKKISKTIEKIPGLGPLIEKIMDSVAVFVFTTLEPFLKPIMRQATSGLMAASGEVIDKSDQYEVFNDPRASDPTHSFLSKDHFNLILNEPAGSQEFGQTYAVNLVVKAWDDSSINVHQATEDILQCMFHPDFHDRNSKIQREMMEYMSKWLGGLGNNRQEVLRRLTKQAVRNHENIRLAGQGGAPAPGGYAQNAGVEAQHNLQGYLNQVPGMSSASAILGKINNTGGSGGGFPSMGQAQSMLGKFSAGGRSGESAGFFSREVEGAPYGGAQMQTSSYSSATMPSGGMETSSYSTTSTYPGQGGGHGHGSGHAASYLGSPNQPEYPPAIPSPSYSSGPGSAQPTPSGYAPAYASSYGPSSYGAPEFPPVNPSYSDNNMHSGGEYGYGGFQPPPPGPPGPPGFPGPAGFPDPYGGPPSFPGGPDQQGYPPPGGYGGPPPPNRPFGW